MYMYTCIYMYMYMYYNNVCACLLSLSFSLSFFFMHTSVIPPPLPLFSLPLPPLSIFQRPPVEWGERGAPKAAAYVFPYVVAWSQEAAAINIFNLIHQRCVQDIPFPVGDCTYVHCFVI